LKNQKYNRLKVKLRSGKMGVFTAKFQNKSSGRYSKYNKGKREFINTKNKLSLYCGNIGHFKREYKSNLRRIGV